MIEVIEKYQKDYLLDQDPGQKVVVQAKTRHVQRNFNPFNSIQPNIENQCNFSASNSRSHNPWIPSPEDSTGRTLLVLFTSKYHLVGRLVVLYPLANRRSLLSRGELHKVSILPTTNPTILLIWNSLVRRTFAINSIVLCIPFTATTANFPTQQKL